MGVAVGVFQRVNASFLTLLRRGIIPVALLLILFGGSYILWYPSHFTSACESGGDISVFALGVERAKHFEALVGPYSRFGFCHPGPAFFYIYALGEWLFSFAEPHSAHRLTQFILNLSLLGLIAFHLPAKSPVVSRVILILTVIMGFRMVRADLLETTWNPASVMMPFLLYVVLAARICSGRIEHLPLWLFTGTLALHNHVATAVPLVVVGLFTLLSLCFGARANFDKVGTPLNGALVGICILLNFLPIYEVITSQSSGNLGAFLAFRAKSSPDKTVTEVAMFIGRHLSPLSLFGVRNQILGLLVIILSLMWCWYDLRTSVTEGRRELWRAVGVAYGAACASAFLVEGKLYPYLMWSSLGLLSLLWWSFLERMYVRLEATNLGAPLSRRGTLIFLATAWSMSLLPLIPSMKALGCGERIVKFREELADFGKEDVRFVLHGQSLWMYTASFYVDLVRQGRSVCVAGSWWHVFGKDSRCQEDAGNSERRSEVIDVHFFGEGQHVKTNQAIIRLGPMQMVIIPPGQN